MEQRDARPTGKRPPWFSSGKLSAKAAALKRHTLALYLAARDPRTPWYAKGCAALIVAYAVSPIDLIPDVIPVLDYLDDLVLIPLGIYLAVRLVPPEILAECQAKAAAMQAGVPVSWRAASVIVALWTIALACGAYLIYKHM